MKPGIEYRLAVEPVPTLLIAGAGHVGAAVARMAVLLDFRTVVIDDRADLMGADRLHFPSRSTSEISQKACASGPSTRIRTSRSSREDISTTRKRCMPSSTRRQVLGLIGSRRKIKLIFDDLAELGVDRAKLESIHSPIGLDIGAVTVPRLRSACRRTRADPTIAIRQDR